MQVLSRSVRNWLLMQGHIYCKDMYLLLKYFSLSTEQNLDESLGSGSTLKHPGTAITCGNQ